MTSANRVDGFFVVLNEVFDPGADRFEDLQNRRGALGTDVLSVLTARPVFWTAHSLKFGYAVDRDADFGEVSPRKHLELFREPGFQAYLNESDLGLRSESLLATASVLDTLMSEPMRREAMVATVAADQCIRDCRGNRACILQCLIDYGG